MQLHIDDVREFHGLTLPWARNVYSIFDMTTAFSCIGKSLMKMSLTWWTNSMASSIPGIPMVLMTSTLNKLWTILKQKVKHNCLELRAIESVKKKSDTVFFRLRAPLISAPPFLNSRDSEKSCLHFHNRLISRSNFVRKKVFFH